MKYPKEKLRALPLSPGVYFFKDKAGKVLYVGKANDLRARVRQYFSRASAQHPKTEALVRESARVTWELCESEVDALIAEARFIKKYAPKYNVLLRDDKNYLFVCVSKELYPRILLTHQPRLFGTSTSKQVIGPFTDGGALRETLRLLRGAYPYCTCRPGTKRACLNYHLGRCPAPCIYPQAVARTKRNVNAIAAILRGKKDTVLKKLEAQMRSAARAERFEKAEEYKRQLERLRNIFAHRFVFRRMEDAGRSDAWPGVQARLQKFLGTTRALARVECYDISNIVGKHAVGSMAVFEQGMAAKGEYRKFKIKHSGDTPDDPRMMAEVLKRRMEHPEWPAPDLIIVDGGKTQLGAAQSVLPKAQLVMGLAKKQEELYTPTRPAPVLAKSLGEETLFFVQRIRDEAHRFAVTYHRKLRGKIR